MTVFLIVAVLMLASALWFVLPPLLRTEDIAGEHAQRDALNLDVLRDQLRELDADRDAGLLDDEGYASSRRELERRVAEDVRPVAPAASVVAAAAGKRWAAIGLGVALPLAAIALYFTLGNLAGLDPARVAAESPQNGGQPQITAEQIAAMVAKLSEHLKQKPDDAEGWAMLARSYTVLGRFGEATDAYAHLTNLISSDAGLWADYADAMAMSKGRSLQGEPEKLIERALRIDPKNIKALALSGAASFERHDYAAAIARWQNTLALVPADSETARALKSSIEEAQHMAGAPAGVKTGSGASDASASGAQVSGRVELDAALRSQAADGDTVFIFARAVDGPPFPLAVLRKQVKDLPATFTLDDSMGMMAGAKLSNFPKVVIGARISKSGSATPGAGDLEGLSAPVEVGAKDVQIKIASVHK